MKRAVFNAWMAVRGSVQFHDVAILCHTPSAPGSTGPLPTISFVVDPVRIVEVHRKLGHHITETRLQSRLRNRLSFVAFSCETETVASSWIAHDGRYADEFSWLLPIAPAEVWLRDVFVAPPARGRRMFSHIVTALAKSGPEGPRRVWSDVDWVNEISMRAHANAGFDIVARLRATEFARRLRWRCPLPDWERPIAEIQPQSRLIWLKGEVGKRHAQLLA